MHSAAECIESTGTDPRQVTIVTRIVTIRPMLLVLLCALLVSAPAAARTYYKWTDENGTVHFTSEPPIDRDYETINTAGLVTGSSRTQGEAEPTQSQESPEDVQMPRQAPPDPEVVAARCEQARENLFWLQSHRRIIVENDDGSETFIDADEQQRMIEENQALIDEWCREDG